MANGNDRITRECNTAKCLRWHTLFLHQLFDGDAVAGLVIILYHNPFIEMKLGRDDVGLNLWLSPIEDCARLEAKWWRGEP